MCRLSEVSSFPSPTGSRERQKSSGGSNVFEINYVERLRVPSLRGWQHAARSAVAPCPPSADVESRSASAEWGKSKNRIRLFPLSASFVGGC